MLFTKRQDFLPPKVGTAAASGAQTITFDVTREFHIESMMLRVNLTAANARASEAQADGVFGFVKRVKVTVADGARTRNVVDCTGAGLIELAKMQIGTLDRNTLACIGVNSAAARQFTIPIFFVPPQMDDPNGSTLLLPAPRFNSNITVEVQLASQAEMDSNGTPTFNPVPTLTLVVNRRQVSILNWPSFDTEIAESSTTFASSITPADIELPVPGHYLGVLGRLYTAATTRGDIGSTPEYEIQQIGTSLRRIRFLDLEAENDLSSSHSQGAAATAIGGLIYFDFLSDRPGYGVGDLGSAFDSNVLSQTGARPKFRISSVTGGAGVKCNLVTHRVFGDISPLKLGR